MERTRNSMPMVTCPSCEKEFQWDDYYDVEVDEVRDCPHCGRGCKVVAKDVEIVVDLEACEPTDVRVCDKCGNTLGTFPVGTARIPRKLFCNKKCQDAYEGMPTGATEIRRRGCAGNPGASAVTF